MTTTFAIIGVWSVTGLLMQIILALDAPRRRRR